MSRILRILFFFFSIHTYSSRVQLERVLTVSNAGLWSLRGTETKRHRLSKPRTRSKEDKRGQIVASGKPRAGESKEKLGEDRCSVFYQCMISFRQSSHCDRWCSILTFVVIIVVVTLIDRRSDTCGPRSNNRHCITYCNEQEEAVKEWKVEKLCRASTQRNGKVSVFFLAWKSVKIRTVLIKLIRSGSHCKYGTVNFPRVRGLPVPRFLTHAHNRDGFICFLSSSLRAPWTRRDSKQ